MLASLLAALAKIPSFIAYLQWGAIFANVKKYWRFYLPAVLVALNLFTGWRLDQTNKALTTEKAAHTRDVNSFRTAAAEATRIANQIRQNLLKESTDRAKQADASYASLLGQYRTNLLRYQANQSASSTTYSYQLPTPQSSDGPSTSAVVPPAATLSGFLAITVEDADVCAVNTARLVAVHDWAIGLPKQP